MKNTIVVYLAVFAIAIQWGPVLASDDNYEIHYMFVDTNLEGVSIEPQALQFKYIKPYSERIDMEGMLAVGVGEDSVNRKIQLATKFSQDYRLTSIVGAYVKAHAVLEPRIWFYAQVGLARVEYDISSSISGVSPDGTVNGTGFAYGMGLSFALLERGAFILEFNQYPDIEVDDVTIDTAALSLGYQMPF